MSANSVDMLEAEPVVADDLYAIVVHHNSRDTLDRTLNSLVAGGVPPRNMVVVDNSGEGLESADLLALLDGRAVLVRTENKGYAAAVNVGIDWCGRQKDLASQSVLVATHEVLIDRATIDGLLSVLNTCPALGAVGPILRNGESSTDIWSTGGILTPRLRLPRHADDHPTSTTVRDWLDGACVLYRGAAIEGRRLPEEYFLYMEEVDFHQQLTADGYGVAVVPVVASQTSGGMPGYYEARNIQILARRWGRRGWSKVAPVYVIARLVARRAIRRNGDSLGKILAGVRDGRVASTR